MHAIVFPTSFNKKWPWLQLVVVNKHTRASEQDHAHYSNTQLYLIFLWDTFEDQYPLPRHTRKHT